MPEKKIEIREELKEKVIKDFLPFIKYTAYRLSWNIPPYLTTDDLESAGFMGLIDALNRFKPGKVKLKTYAELRIKGSIIDELRAAAWIPRRTRNKIDKINEMRVILERRHGRKTEDIEVAKALKMSLKKYFELLKYANLRIIRMEDVKSANPKYNDLDIDISECIADTNAKDPINILKAKENNKKLIELIKELPLRERVTLLLYYFEELPMEEIGKVFRLTEGAICLIHSAAIKKLREKLGCSNTEKIRVAGRNRRN